MVWKTSCILHIQSLSAGCIRFPALTPDLTFYHEPFWFPLTFSHTLSGCFPIDYNLLDGTRVISVLYFVLVVSIRSSKIDPI